MPNLSTDGHKNATFGAKNTNPITGISKPGYGGGVDTISTENDDNRARRGKDERQQKIQVTQPANISQPKYSL